MQTRTKEEFIAMVRTEMEQFAVEWPSHEIRMYHWRMQCNCYKNQQAVLFPEVSSSLKDTRPDTHYVFVVYLAYSRYYTDLYGNAGGSSGRILSIELWRVRSLNGADGCKIDYDRAGRGDSASVGRSRGYRSHRSRRLCCRRRPSSSTRRHYLYQQHFKDDSRGEEEVEDEEEETAAEEVKEDY